MEYTLATQVGAEGISVHEVRVITEPPAGVVGVCVYEVNTQIDSNAIDSRLWYLTAVADHPLQQAKSDAEMIKKALM